LTRALARWGGINDYLNPFVTNVTDNIAKLGARNLSENLLPSVSDAFVRAGQFGGSRMGEFGSRALRDTQEAVLGQQAQALQSGYGQALSASSADLSRQGTLAGTAGNLTQGQQGVLAGLGGQLGGLASQDMTRSQGVLGQIADLGGQSQNQLFKDSAALESAGNAIQNNSQRQMDSNYQQWLIAQGYPKEQVAWLGSQLTGQARSTPTTTTTTNQPATTTPSPLSQLAGGAAGLAGLVDLFKTPTT